MLPHPSLAMATVTAVCKLSPMTIIQMRLNFWSHCALRNGRIGRKLSQIRLSISRYRLSGGLAETESNESNWKECKLSQIRLSISRYRLPGGRESNESNWKESIASLVLFVLEGFVVFGYSHLFKSNWIFGTLHICSINKVDDGLLITLFLYSVTG